MTKTFIFDLDGTIYRGGKPIEGVIDAIEEIKGMGFEVFFMTNSATKSRIETALKLSKMGLDATSEQVYCGSYILAKFIKNNFSEKNAYIIGEKGIEDEFEKAGIKITEDAPIVAVGLDRKLTYDKLAHAHKLICKGAKFVASNGDVSFPVEEGSLPGAGSIVKALEYSTGVKAQIVGKPDKFGMELIEKENKIKREEIVFVGDRVDTDMVFAKNSGVKSIFVLSGISKKEDLEDLKPDLILNSVAQIPQNIKKII